MALEDKKEELKGLIASLKAEITVLPAIDAKGEALRDSVFTAIQSVIDFQEENMDILGEEDIEYGIGELEKQLESVRSLKGLWN